MMSLNNYVKARINRMARANHTVLTPRHEEILEYAYKYYEKNKVGPLFFTFKKHVGATKTEINSLFPHGLSSVYTWVGIPIQKAEEPCKPAAKIKVDDYREVYLDHNATTYVRREVVDLLVHYYSGKLGFANPSSATLQGKKSYDLIYSARQTIARCLSVEPEEVVFTGCGSEANNLAIKGIAFKHLGDFGHIITSKIEHPAVLKTVQYLESIGFEATYVSPERDGSIAAQSVEKALRDDTILVSIMAVNNEIGSINPIKEIGHLCKAREIPFMVDAIQGFGKIPLYPKDWGVSMLSISGHKIYAPKGVGGLFIDHDVHPVPLIHGGGQEMGIRAGTENVAQILAFGKAAELACEEMAREFRRFIELRDFFLAKLKKIEPDFILNGGLKNRNPNNLSIGFPNVDPAALLLSLNQIGVCVSAGSACSSGKTETSHVLRAIGIDDQNYGTIRFSFGLKTTKGDLEYMFRYLPEILDQIKEGL